MKILIGLGMAVVFGLLYWWAFVKAAGGENFYNWIWVPAGFLAAFGVILAIVQIIRWMRN